MSIRIVVSKVNDALYLRGCPILIGKCLWLVDVEDEWYGVVLMLVRTGRAKYYK